MGLTLLNYAGLYLPSSDMDIVVMDSQCGDIRSALKAVANSLVRKNMAKNIQVSIFISASLCKLSQQATVPRLLASHSRTMFCLAFKCIRGLGLRLILGN